MRVLSETQTIMSAFKFLPTTVLCIALTGCQSFIDALTVPIEPAHAVVREPRPVVAAPRSVATPVVPVNLDFRILEAHARISGRDYVMDASERPVITALGGDTYRLDLTLRRDSNSSLRGDETLTTHFYYDGAELIFFADRNGNHRFDRRESYVRYLITHTQEIITDGNRRYVQLRSLNVSLRDKHLDSWSRVKTLEMRLVFVTGR